MAFWWWGNVFMSLWALTTMVAGIRYADGRAVNGPMAWLGSIFDKTFGLDTCRKIPSDNQKMNNLKNPAYFCRTPAPYPHGGNSSFVVNYPQPPNVMDVTGVSGVGGVTSGHITGHSSKTIDPVTYITQIFTGSSTGSIAAGQYDKKRFKQGTPYISQQTGNTVGYYYTTDAKGQEVPIIPPYTGGAALPAAFQSYVDNYTGTVGAMATYPVGWNAYVNYSNTTNGPSGTVFTNPLTDGIYTYPSKTAPFDPLNGFVNNASNVALITGPLSNVQDLKYKSFSISPESGANQASNPTAWKKR